jgi:hypothetical protein
VLFGTAVYVFIGMVLASAVDEFLSFRRAASTSICAAHDATLSGMEPD